MSYESPTIRPPSEWRSGLLRITRGCQWNRCRFCGIYPHLGQHDFSIRPLKDILCDLKEIAIRRPEVESLFLGDADPLCAPEETVVSTLRSAGELLSLQRITSYARFSTLKKLGPEQLAKYRSAGLSRLHCGLESGNDLTLTRMRKGQNRQMIIEVSQWLSELEFELSVYVLLGLGGRDDWRRHIEDTASLLGLIKPSHIRIRRLFVYPPTSSHSPPCPLVEEINNGSFIEQTPEGTVRELELLLKCLPPIPSFFTCDHLNNFVNVAGFLDRDSEFMLKEINEFLSLPAEQRQNHYSMIGSGI